jgi:Tol biopolymer transport system component
MRQILRKLFPLLILISLLIDLVPFPAYATYPGANGKINALEYDTHANSGCGTDGSQLGQTLFDSNLTSPAKITLTENGSPLTVGELSWSPEGSQYSFISDVEDNIGIANADGSKLFPGYPYLTDTHAPYYSTYPLSVAWSTDGYTLAIGLKNNGLIQRSIAFPYPIFITWGENGASNFSDLSWSPKGDYIAYTKKVTVGSDIRDQIGVIHPDGSNLQLFSKASTTSFDQDPDWSPDATKIVFASNRSQEGASPNDEPTQIFTMNTDGSNVTQLTNSYAYRYEHPVWSPDGSKILITRTDLNTGVMTLVTLSATTGAEIDTYTPACNVGFRSIGWQPLGRTIIYRLANWQTKERLFTLNKYEALLLNYSQGGWVLEGPAFNTQDAGESGATPIYRLANWKTHERLFTSSPDERDYALAHYEGWVSEGTAFYASPTQATGMAPIYRLANWKTHERLFTASSAERDYAVAHYDGWVSEGVAFYVPGS